MSEPVFLDVLIGEVQNVAGLIAVTAVAAAGLWLLFAPERRR